MQQYIYEKQRIAKVAKFEFMMSEDDETDEDGGQRIFGEPIGAIRSIDKGSNPKDKKGYQIKFE